MPDSKWTQVQLTFTEPLKFVIDGILSPAISVIIALLQVVVTILNIVVSILTFLNDPLASIINALITALLEAIKQLEATGIHFFVWHSNLNLESLFDTSKFADNVQAETKKRIEDYNKNNPDRLKSGLDDLEALDVQLSVAALQYEAYLKELKQAEEVGYDSFLSRFNKSLADDTENMRPMLQPEMPVFGFAMVMGVGGAAEFSKTLTLISKIYGIYQKMFNLKPDDVVPQGIGFGVFKGLDVSYDLIDDDPNSTKPGYEFTVNTGEAMIKVFNDNGDANYKLIKVESPSTYSYPYPPIKTKNFIALGTFGNEYIDEIKWLNPINGVIFSADPISTLGSFEDWSKENDSVLRVKQVTGYVANIGDSLRIETSLKNKKNQAEVGDFYITGVVTNWFINGDFLLEIKSINHIWVIISEYLNKESLANFGEAYTFLAKFEVDKTGKIINFDSNFKRQLPLTYYYEMMRSKKPNLSANAPHVWYGFRVTDMPIMNEFINYMFDFIKSLTVLSQLSEELKKLIKQIQDFVALLNEAVTTLQDLLDNLKLLVEFTAMLAIKPITPFASIYSDYDPFALEDSEEYKFNIKNPDGDHNVTITAKKAYIENNGTIFTKYPYSSEFFDLHYTLSYVQILDGTSLSLFNISAPYPTNKALSITGLDARRFNIPTPVEFKLNFFNKHMKLAGNFCDLINLSNRETNDNALVTGDYLYTLPVESQIAINLKSDKFSLMDGSNSLLKYIGFTLPYEGRGNISIPYSPNINITNPSTIKLNTTSSYINTINSPLMTRLNLVSNTKNPQKLTGSNIQNVSFYTEGGFKVSSWIKKLELDDLGILKNLLGFNTITEQTGRKITGSSALNLNNLIGDLKISTYTHNIGVPAFSELMATLGFQNVIVRSLTSNKSKNSLEKVYDKKTKQMITRDLTLVDCNLECSSTCDKFCDCILNIAQGGSIRGEDARIATLFTIVVKVNVYFATGSPLVINKTRVVNQKLTMTQLAKLTQDMLREEQELFKINVVFNISTGKFEMDLPTTTGDPAMTAIEVLPVGSGEFSLPDILGLPEGITPAVDSKVKAPDEPKPYIATENTKTGVIKLGSKDYYFSLINDQLNKYFNGTELALIIQELLRSIGNGDEFVTYDPITGKFTIITSPQGYIQIDKKIITFNSEFITIAEVIQSLNNISSAPDAIGDEKFSLSNLALKLNSLGLRRVTFEGDAIKTRLGLIDASASSDTYTGTAVLFYDLPPLTPFNLKVNEELYRPVLPEGTYTPSTIADAINILYPSKVNCNFETDKFSLETIEEKQVLFDKIISISPGDLPFEGLANYLQNQLDNAYIVSLTDNKYITFNQIGLSKFNFTAPVSGHDYRDVYGLYGIVEGVDSYTSTTEIKPYLLEQNDVVKLKLGSQEHTYTFNLLDLHGIAHGYYTGNSVKDIINNKLYGDATFNYLNLYFEITPKTTGYPQIINETLYLPSGFITFDTALSIYNTELPLLTTKTGDEIFSRKNEIVTFSSDYMISGKFEYVSGDNFLTVLQFPTTTVIGKKIESTSSIKNFLINSDYNKVKYKLIDTIIEDIIPNSTGYLNLTEFINYVNANLTNGVYLLHAGNNVIFSTPAGGVTFIDETITFPAQIGNSYTLSDFLIMLNLILNPHHIFVIIDNLNNNKLHIISDVPISTGYLNSVPGKLNVLKMLGFKEINLDLNADIPATEIERPYIITSVSSILTVTSGADVITYNLPESDVEVYSVEELVLLLQGIVTNITINEINNKIMFTQSSVGYKYKTFIFNLNVGIFSAEDIVLLIQTQMAGHPTYDGEVFEYINNKFRFNFNACATSLIGTQFEFSTFPYYNNIGYSDIYHTIRYLPDTDRFWVSTTDFKYYMIVPGVSDTLDIDFSKKIENLTLAPTGGANPEELLDIVKEAFHTAGYTPTDLVTYNNLTGQFTFTPDPSGKSYQTTTPVAIPYYNTYMSLSDIVLELQTNIQTALGGDTTFLVYYINGKFVFKYPYAISMKLFFTGTLPFWQYNIPSATDTNAIVAALENLLGNNFPGVTATYHSDTGICDFYYSISGWKFFIFNINIPELISYLNQNQQYPIPGFPKYVLSYSSGTLSIKFTNTYNFSLFLGMPHNVIIPATELGVNSEVSSPNDTAVFYIARGVNDYLGVSFDYFAPTEIIGINLYDPEKEFQTANNIIKRITDGINGWANVKILKLVFAQYWPLAPDADKYVGNIYTEEMKTRIIADLQTQTYTYDWVKGMVNKMEDVEKQVFQQVKNLGTIGNIGSLSSTISNVQSISTAMDKVRQTAGICIVKWTMFWPFFKIAMELQFIPGIPDDQFEAVIKEIVTRNLTDFFLNKDLGEVPSFYIDSIMTMITMAKESYGFNPRLTNNNGKIKILSPIGGIDSTVYIDPASTSLDVLGFTGISPVPGEGNIHNSYYVSAGEIAPLIEASGVGLKSTTIMKTSITIFASYPNLTYYISRANPIVRANLSKLLPMINAIWVYDFNGRLGKDSWLEYEDGAGSPNAQFNFPTNRVTGGAGIESVTEALRDPPEGFPKDAIILSMVGILAIPDITALGDARMWFNLIGLPPPA